nr:hypothetical protein GCM10025699_33580 [Microbacterium flavescens]
MHRPGPGSWRRSSLAPRQPALDACPRPLVGWGHERPHPELWRRVDAYLTEILVGHDPGLERAVADQNAAGLPAIEVAPVNGKFLHLLTRISGARRVLEIGTLGAYSTIWMARGIPADGRVITIEAEPRIAEIARANLERAGVADKVEVRLGRAADVLPTLDGVEPFDLVFIDADKESNTIYLDWAARLGRPGTVVVVDNTVRGERWRTRPPRIRRSSACSAVSRCSDAIRASMPRPCRRSTSRVMTASRSRSSCDARGGEGLRETGAPVARHPDH